MSFINEPNLCDYVKAKSPYDNEVWCRIPSATQCIMVQYEMHIRVLTKALYG